MTYEFLNDLMSDLEQTGVHVRDFGLSEEGFAELRKTTPPGRWRPSTVADGIYVMFDSGLARVDELVALDP